MSFLKPVPEPREEPSQPRTAASGTGLDTYVAKVLSNVAGGIAEGKGRNDRLNHAAYTLGTLVGGGQLDYHDMAERLQRTGEAAGLEAREIPGTIRSGLSSGEQSPRTLEEREWKTSANTTTPQAANSSGTSGSTGAPEGGTPDASTAGQSATDEATTLAQEIRTQRARRDARRHLDAEDAVKAFREPAWRPTLTAELLIPDEPVSYTIDQVLPTGGNALLTAQFKAGKTTLVNQLAKALADHRPFLDRFDVNIRSGRVALFNYEVDDRQYRRWLRDVGISNTDNVVILNLRGFRLPITAPFIEDWTVRWLSDHEVTTWVVDPFARAFTGGNSENDNAEVGRFLDTLDVIKKRAGVSDLILPTHTGREQFEEGQERTRGATRLDDWADVRWFLTKDDEEVRYFRATGRDVDVLEEKLTYSESERAYVFGGGDKAWEKKRRCDARVLAAITAEPGISGNKLEDVIGGHKNEVSDAVRRLETSRQIRLDKGGKGLPTRHYLGGGSGVFV